MRYPLLKNLAVAVVSCALMNLAQASAQKCEVDRPVAFGGMSWESNLVLAEIERFIMEKGYGCETEILPTETLPALAALERGNLDINSEIWLNSMIDAWEKAEKTGKVKRLGSLYMGGEAWYIPRYTAEALPGLKSAADLPRFKDAFQDPEEPGKGRFYGCPAGWACEVTSGNLFRSLGLGDAFTLFSPGSGAAQKAALISAYKRRQNVVFYYWAPTPLVGMLDLVELELPPHDAEKHKCLTAVDCEDPRPSAYPDNPVFTGVNTRFAQQAPKLAEFLSMIEFPLPVLNETLAYMEENSIDAPEVAQWFLKNKPDIWKSWLPDDVAERVRAAL
jgi:glycine betaine/proline transport system substrate-binding protein